MASHRLTPHRLEILDIWKWASIISGSVFGWTALSYIYAFPKYCSVAYALTFTSVLALITLVLYGIYKYLERKWYREEKEAKEAEERLAKENGDSTHIYHMSPATGEKLNGFGWYKSKQTNLWTEGNKVSGRSYTLPKTHPVIVEQEEEARKLLKEYLELKLRVLNHELNITDDGKVIEK